MPKRLFRIKSYEPHPDGGARLVIEFDPKVYERLQREARSVGLTEGDYLIAILRVGVAKMSSKKGRAGPGA